MTIIPYHGGPVLSSALVHAVFWSANVSASITGTMPEFLRTIAASDYVGWLSEYDTAGVDGGTGQHIGPGSYGQTIAITPSNTSAQISDADIAAELAHQVAIGALPAPETDASGHPRSLYMVFFPSSVQIAYSGGQSCVQFSGYHGATTVGGGALVYGVVPDCGMGVEKPASHELAEAITDPLPGQAWYLFGNGPPQGEIGDLCQTAVAYLGHVVQQLWSNAHGRCQALAPVCNGTNAPCRACTTADDHDPALGGCTGLTPYCATDANDPRFGTCVACRDDSQCPGFCDRTTDTCVGCVADTDCAPPTPLCDPSARRCVACTSNVHCAGPTPICDVSSGTCRACNGVAECGPPRCDAGGGRCAPDAGETGDAGARLDAADGAAVDRGGGCATSPRAARPSSIGLVGWLALLVIRRSRRR